MHPNLQRRVQRYGWDKAASYYENSWQEQLKPAHDLLIETSNVQYGDHIIDLAAGTGLVSFRLLEKAGEKGNLLATDLSDEMINIGNTLSQLAKLENIKFKREDAENIDSVSNSYDLATCALGLMYFPEPENALSEMHRVLKPGGRAVTAVWGSRKNCGWADIFPIVDKRVNTDVCPMFFNLGESEVIKYPFENAGFKDIKIQKIKTTLFYTSSEEACDASFLGGPVAMAYSRFDTETKKAARKEYIRLIEKHKTDRGYEIPGEFVICSGIK
ncbi:MAG: class I SAM-dependent methyltransferase [Flavobacteriaceae bacterium]|nr:class I SAM-dependent methyltransferase [Flavobacteriaceae bacterium]